MRRYMSIGMVTTLEPGDEKTIQSDVKGVFRPEKVIMCGFMKPIRGNFKIKRSRLPLLNRDDVEGSSRIYKCRRGSKVWFRKGKTTISYNGDGKKFTRSYLPSSVEYRPVDALSYICLKQLYCGKDPAFVESEDGIPSEMFGSNRYGNSFPMPTTSSCVSMLLKNVGDVQVRVSASILGTEYCE